ncbi:uncharacterized protein BJ212DRAFT_1474709 [Suillus subaureus]|uniref:Uncharacterized protein n=1 Tax=Suillus subaureus TaxID=48587 RepID=A0A9P7EPE0_9AGAM|nr:uncharacterized protein BJ212DRAFT_1474709 [Suillus subaureus]KAG1827557.1 hypothetical protein BJ212DRAFT_1474709 [Suillus subaureus]
MHMQTLDGEFACALFHHTDWTLVQLKPVDEKGPHAALEIPPHLNETVRQRFELTDDALSEAPL